LVEAYGKKVVSAPVVDTGLMLFVTEGFEYCERARSVPAFDSHQPASLIRHGG
jgi:hypothetical protein